jgi:hypothetical protein
MKIGKYVRTTITLLIEEKKINSEMIMKMQDLNYSKTTFNINYPVLKLVNSNVNVATQRNDKHGYPRYYSRTVSSYGKTYLICSQWIENLHRAKFEKWVDLISLL